MSGDAKGASAASNARAIRKARAKRLLFRFTLWVGLPTFLAVVYYGFWASSQYESVCTVAVQSSDENQKSMGTLEALLPATNSNRDTLWVKEYIESRDILHDLEKKHQLINYFQSDSIDFFSRLSKDASFEEAYSYFLDRIQADFDTKSGMLRISVRAFSAEQAREISKSILESAEVMINNLSDRIRKDRMAFSESEIKKAEKRLTDARKALLRVQSEGEGGLNPKGAMDGILLLRSQLEGELAKAQAEWSALNAVYNKGAPQLTEARAKVRSFSAQNKTQNPRLADSGHGSLAASALKIEPYVIEKQFAQEAYALALKSLSISKLEASRQQSYLVTISEPSRPDTPTHPRRFWKIITVFFVSLSMGGVFSLLWAAIREHARF